MVSEEEKKLQMRVKLMSENLCPYSIVTQNLNKEFGNCTIFQFEFSNILGCEPLNDWFEERKIILFRGLNRNLVDNKRNLKKFLESVFLFVSHWWRRWMLKILWDHGWIILDTVNLLPCFELETTFVNPKIIVWVINFWNVMQMSTYLHET